MLALSKPSSESFQEILGDPLAKPPRAYAWIFITSLIRTVLFGILQFFISGNPFEQLDFGLDASLWLGTFGVALCCLAPFGALFSVLSMIIGTGLTQWVAGGLGGRGSYSELIYTTAAFSAPLGLLSSLVAGIPWVNLLTIVLGFYGLVLNVLAVKAVNRFSTMRAFMSILLVWFGFVMLTAFLAAMMLVLFAPVLREMFQEIQNQLLPFLPTT